MNELLREYAEAGRIKISDENKEKLEVTCLVLPKSENIREALLVAGILAQEFGGNIAGVKSLYVREYIGDGFYGPFGLLPCVKVVTGEGGSPVALTLALQPLLEKEQERWDVLSFDLREGTFPSMGETRGYATMIVGDVCGVSYFPGKVADEVADEFDLVFTNLQKLMPDALSALNFANKKYFYYLGEKCAFKATVRSLQEGMQITVECEDYTEMMGTCRNLCREYGKGCKNCALGLMGAKGRAWL